jgi:hypothetical protein
MIKTQSNIDAYRKALKWSSREAFPRAVAHSLNAAADAVASAAQKNAKQKLTIRTPFTLRSIKQDRHARGNDIGKMFSRAMVRAPYLEPHDEGATIKAKNTTHAIPYPTARGGSIKRRIMRRYAMNRLGNLANNPKFFMGLPKGGNRPPGIWERTRGGKLKPIRYTGSPTVRVKATRFWSEAERRYASKRFVEAQFVKEAEKQLRKIRK